MIEYRVCLNSKPRIQNAYMSEIESRPFVDWTDLNFMCMNLDLECKQTARRDKNLKRHMYTNICIKTYVYKHMYTNKDIAGFCNTHKLSYQKANL